MRKINIIHLSDMHIDKNNDRSTIELTNCILDDINKFVSEYSSVDLLFFSGDLIYSGQNNGELYSLAEKNFILPFIKGKIINSENIFICQGNHENNLDEFDEVIYDGINSQINSIDSINKLWKTQNIYKYIRNDTKIFNNFFKNVNNQIKNISELSSWAIKDINGYSIGIAIFNSSWFSCGSSQKDYGKLIISFPEVELVYEKIKNTDFKIAMFHHPTEQLCEIDRIECEKIFKNFDLILNGHTHITSHFQKFSEVTNTLYLCAGQLNDTKGDLNGYSIIQIDPFSKEICVNFKNYYPKRNCFDISIKDAKDGKAIYNLQTNNVPLKESYKLSNVMSAYYLKELEEKLITNILYKNTECKYIDPYIKNTSEFTEFTNNKEDKTLTIEEIIQSNLNYILFGKINYGKSTTLKIIAHKCCCAFDLYKKLPVLLDFKCLDLKGKNQLFRAIKKLLSGEYNCEIKISDENLDAIIKKGYCIILIDNYEATNNKHKEIISIFLEKYPNVQMIITQQENILDYYNFDKTFDSLKTFKKVYLQPIKKIMIIDFYKEVDKEYDEKIYYIIDKTTSAISELGMGKTPFNIIMLMNIYQDDEDYTVINEANVVERFMELLLEKINISENYISSFDFRNKEDFLISVAKYMHENDKYIILKSEFDNLVIDFFKPYGLDHTKSNFETVFFEKKILFLLNDEVSFNYKFILDYYIAKSFVKHGLPKFIFENFNYLEYLNELNYYSGIKRDADDLFCCVQKDIVDFLKKYGNDMNYIDNYEIDLSIDFIPPSKSLSIEEKSELTDKPDFSQKYNPRVYSKQSDDLNSTYIEKNDIEILFLTLSVFSRLLRNMDYVKKEEKIDSIIYCIKSCCVILNKFCEQITSQVTEKYDLIKENVEKNDSMESIDNYIREIASMFKMTMPVAIEACLFEWMGNKKLIPIFNHINLNNKFDNMEEFFFSTLYLDLHTSQSYEKIKLMIKKTNNDSILKLLYIKLISVYMLTTSSREEKNVENLIIDLIDKQKPKSKSHNRKSVLNRAEAIKDLRNRKREDALNQ